MMSKKNKMKLVSNIKTNQNSYNTIANDDQIPSAGLPKNLKSISQIVLKLSSQKNPNFEQMFQASPFLAHSSLLIMAVTISEEIQKKCEIVEYNLARLGLT